MSADGLRGGSSMTTSLSSPQSTFVGSSQVVGAPRCLASSTRAENLFKKKKAVRYSRKTKTIYWQNTKLTIDADFGWFRRFRYFGHFYFLKWCFLWVAVIIRLYAILLFLNSQINSWRFCLECLFKIRNSTAAGSGWGYAPPLYMPPNVFPYRLPESKA